MDKKRIPIEDIYMGMAFLLAHNSHDSQTQHGCIFVKNNSIICAGLNGFPPGAPDSQLPTTRPEKYPYINHAEENAILRAAKLGISLAGSSLYITGLPCTECTKKLVSIGVTDWTVGPRSYNKNNLKEEELRSFWINHYGVKITFWDKTFEGKLDGSSVGV